MKTAEDFIKLLSRFLKKIGAKVCSQILMDNIAPLGIWVAL